MNEVRFGIVGLGNIGLQHAATLTSGRVRRARLAAVCTSDPAKAARFPGAVRFDSASALARSGQVDAVLVATPHPEHLSAGLTVLEEGLHLLMEKPLASHKADAERLVQAAGRRPDLVFGAMFQLRMEPRYQMIRELILGGRLGRLVRFTWIMTDWYRTEAYYASGGWRATWAGEGGGVLINQCLHNLDLLQWLLGMPRQVHGYCDLGKHHNIEVEDEVTSCWEFPSGMRGVLIASTGEAPGTNRLEIAGTLGKLTLEKDRLTWHKNQTDMIEFSRQSPGGFTKPACEEKDIPFGNLESAHAALIQNFADAVLDGEPLIAPGSEGVGSIELANAIVYSSLLGRPVDLPLAGAAWAQKLEELARNSTQPKRVVRSMLDDFGASFRK